MNSSVSRVSAHSLTILFAASALASGCATQSSEVHSVGPAEPARRAASSFVHCLEQDGGGCVTRDPKQGAWDAFAILSWIGSGTPLSILQAVRRELDHHRDPLAIQDRFVITAARYREALRGAECSPESAQLVLEVMPALVQRVSGRMKSLGLWRDDYELVISGLAQEASEGLAGGWIVHMRCFSDPYDVWVATAVEEERQVVVGFTTNLPPWLGGGVLNARDTDQRVRSGARLGSTSLGVVREGSVESNWMPFPMEEF